MRALFGALRRHWLDTAVVVACTVFTLLITWSRGADVSWDMLNYHVYSAFGFLQGRLPSEFMAAGMVSYLNPLPMVPFYSMLAAGWHSLAIGIALALAHTVNLVLLWMICRRLFAGQELALPLTLLAMLIGAASPLFIAEISTSYADITTSIPVLGGVLLLLGAPRRARVLAAGALLGAAVGLKLTNFPFAVAAAAFVLVPETSWRQRGAGLCWLVLGGLAGAVLTGGYWAWVLYAEFDNPVFPFANSLFRSPDFPVTGHVHHRFLPLTLEQALAFPFYLAISKPWVYTELIAPDLRFALCFLAGAVALLLSLLGRKTRTAGPTSDGGLGPRLLAYVALSWTLWLVQFANGRYLLPLTLLVGPALVIALAMFLSARNAVRAAFACAVLQLGQLSVAGVASFGESGQWNEHWIKSDIPRRLVERPYLYLGLEIQSYSYLAASVHPQSRFLNVNGMVPLDVVGPGGERVKQQLARFKGATRTLMSTSESWDFLASGGAQAVDVDLNRFGLRVDARDCALIGSSVMRPRFTGQALEDNSSSGGMVPELLLSCALIPAPPNPAVQAARAQAAQLFDKIESTCPRQFPARWNGVIMRSKNNLFWSRYYADTDLWMYASDKHVYISHSRLGLERIGTPAGMMNGTEGIPCEQIRWRETLKFGLDEDAAEHR